MRGSGGTKKQWIDTHRGLVEHGLFWLATLLPITLGLVLMICAAALDNQIGNVNLSTKGWKNFYEAYKVQIWITALSIPLGGVVARIHGSAQSAEALKSASQQNNFRNAMDHLGLFAELCRQKKAESDGIITEVADSESSLLHSSLFPRSLEGDFSNEGLLGHAENVLEKAEELYCHNTTTRRPEAIEALKESVFVFMRQCFPNYESFFTYSSGEVSTGELEPITGEYIAIEIGEAATSQRDTAQALLHMIAVMELWRTGLTLFNRYSALRVLQIRKAIVSIQSYTDRLNQDVYEGAASAGNTKAESDILLVQLINKPSAYQPDVCDYIRRAKNAY